MTEKGAARGAGAVENGKPTEAQRGDGFRAERKRLGAQIRELRHSHGLTSRHLAKRAGVSASMISQLENGHIDASVVTLRRIAASLEVPIADFFLDQEPGDAAEEESNQAAAPEPLARIVRADRRKRLQIPQSNFTFELLSPDLQGSIEFCWFELEPGQPQKESMAHRVGGEEYVLVLQGTMHLVIGDQVHVLGPGDSCVFDPAVPHRIENRGEEKLIQVSAITPPSF